MDSKLTLSVDKSLAEKAKLYARSQGRSLSDLVESYFKVLTTDTEESVLEVSSKLKSMKGVLKVSDKYDHKKELSDSLSKKYLK
ncbi:DUF6364 family protein [Bacteroidota bacterium]